MLAGALTHNNAALVKSSIGRQPTNGELYIAHFLGADGAGRLINGVAKHPHKSAAAMFPHAAAANHSIFYDKTGRSRSVGEVYGKLTRLFDSARDVTFAQGGVNGRSRAIRDGAAVAASRERQGRNRESGARRACGPGCIRGLAGAAGAHSITQSRRSRAGFGACQ